MFSVSARNTNAGIAQRQTEARGLAVKASSDAIIAGYRDRCARMQGEIESLKTQNDELRSSALHNARRSLLKGSETRAALVIAEISELHDIPIYVIKGPSRAPLVAAARQHAMYEVRRRCHWMGLLGIAKIFDRDHTTVLHGIKAWPQKARVMGIDVLPIEQFPALSQHEPLIFGGQDNG